VSWSSHIADFTVGSSRSFKHGLPAMIRLSLVTHNHKTGAKCADFLAGNLLNVLRRFVIIRDSRQANV